VELTPEEEELTPEQEAELAAFLECCSYPPGETLPSSRPRSDGRVLVHNHIRHTPRTRQGENGFRFWFQDRNPPKPPEMPAVCFRLTEADHEAAVLAVTKMTHELAANTGHDHNTCAAEVDDEMLERGIPLSNLSARLGVLAEASAMYPREVGRQTPEEMELARSSEPATEELELARGSAPAASDDLPAGAKVDDLVARYPGMLSSAPRRGLTHLATIGDESTRDRR
jgi:hypothetical protein